MLVIVVVTKFTKGAYLVLIAMPILYALMRAINRHYSRVATELETESRGLMLPGRNHVVVLVSKLHRPTMRALAFARATRPDTLTALTVNIDDEETRALLAEWERHDLPVQLTVLDSPYREVTSPIINYVRQLRRDRPNDVVNVFIPEYVVGHWWEQLLHNQSALRLKGRLLFQPGVMVTSVPWQMDSSRSRAESVAEAAAAGRGRRRAEATETAVGDARGATTRADRAGRSTCSPIATDRSDRAADPRRLDLARRGARARGRRRRARRALRGSDRRRAPVAGSSSCGTRCPASARGCWSPRTPADRSCAADAIEVLRARRPTGSHRRARTPDRDGAAAATGSTRARRRSAR